MRSASMSPRGCRLKWSVAKRKAGSKVRTLVGAAQRSQGHLRSRARDDPGIRRARQASRSANHAQHITAAQRSAVDSCADRRPQLREAAKSAAQIAGVVRCSSIRRGASGRRDRRERRGADRLDREELHVSPRLPTAERDAARGGCSIRSRCPTSSQSRRQTRSPADLRRQCACDGEVKDPIRCHGAHDRLRCGRSNRRKRVGGNRRAARGQRAVEIRPAG